MKRIIYVAAFILMSLFTLNVQPSFARAKKELTSEQQAKLDSIENRVNEIQHMDKSNLSKSEKRELKTELKTMKKQANAIAGGGVYLSITAIVIIILVLIILL